MSKSAVITTRLDQDTLAALDKLAASTERTRAWVAAKAIRRYIEEQTAFDAFIQAGETSIDRGDYLMQEQMEDWLEQRYRAADVA